MESFQPQLMMALDQLSNLSAVKLPEGYTVRSFQPEDEEAWEEIINDSFRKESDYVKEMHNDNQYAPERVMFICHIGRPIATASAWYRGEWGEDTGYLHMVGIHFSHGGKGLGLQVSLAALHRMREEGRNKAVLHTDDFRLPALKTYVKLGFVPRVVHENQIKRWQSIAEALGNPSLLKYATESSSS
jgi:mycothiol synthase